MIVLDRVPDLYVAERLDQTSLGDVGRDKSALVVYDPQVFRLHAHLRPGIEASFRRTFFVEILRPEPHAEDIERAAEGTRQCESDFVVSVGGGSTIDTAKGVAHLRSNTCRLPRRFERPGRFKNALPHIAVPTTAGPGAEASPAMIFRASSESYGAIVDPRLLPRSVLVIPELATSIPPGIDAGCVLDGISHSIESWLSNASNPLSRNFAATALRIFIREADRAIGAGTSSMKREHLALASFISSTGLRISRVGAVHAMASAMMRDVACPHGQCIAAILIVLLEEFTDTRSGRDEMTCLAKEVGCESYKVFLGILTTFFRRFVGGQVVIHAPTSEQMSRWIDWSWSDPRLACCPLALTRDRAMHAYERIVNALQQTDSRPSVRHA